MNALDRRVQDFAAARFGGQVELKRLAGDASNRSFYRLASPELTPLVLMVHPEPFRLDELPYFLHQRFLSGIGAAVPEIIASYPDEGVIVLQDLGDETLQRHLETCDPARRRFLYLQAVQIIAFLQCDGTRALTADVPASRTVLGPDRLLFELRFFMEHYVEALLGSPLDEASARELDEWLERLAREVGGYRRVLCHRDYHSRNLMVKGDRIYLVDFQDARLGPYTYDLASLVRDSYVVLPENLSAELVGFFRETAEVPEPPEVFASQLRRTGLQRGIKAIGTFASQAVVRGNRGYLPYIRPALESIRRALGEDPADAPILRVFSGALDYR